MSRHIYNNLQDNFENGTWQIRDDKVNDECSLHTVIVQCRMNKNDQRRDVTDEGQDECGNVQYGQCDGGRLRVGRLHPRQVLQ